MKTITNVEPNVAIVNQLYSQWGITAPAKDTSTALTQDPTKVYFTNRYYGFAPLRLHPHHISVRKAPESFVPVQFGQITKYLLNHGINVDIWVLTSPIQSLEQAETDYYNMITEVKRILRVYSTSMGSNIQSVLLERTVHDETGLEKQPFRLHAQLRCTAKLYETVTS